MISFYFFLDHYLYIETSDPAKPGQKARLRSDTIPFARRDQCLVFYYHMFGRDIDTLNVYIETEGEVRLHWSLKGNQGNSWQRGKIPIRRGYGEFKVHNYFELFCYIHLSFHSQIYVKQIVY